MELSNYRKIYSMSLVIRKMHFETTLRYHSTFTRMAKMKKTDNTKCWQNISHKNSWECKILQALWNIICHFLIS